MAEALTSVRPYLLRAFYEWVLDNGLTPYIIVDTDVPGVAVPPAAVKDGRVVLNISPRATQGLQIGNDAILFGARFGGVHQDLTIPVAAVNAIYARENGRGITFADVEEPPPPSDGAPQDNGPGGDRPRLRLVKS